MMMGSREDRLPAHRRSRSDGFEEATRKFSNRDHSPPPPPPPDDGGDSKKWRRSRVRWPQLLLCWMAALGLGMGIDEMFGPLFHWSRKSSRRRHPPPPIVVEEQEEQRPVSQLSTETIDELRFLLGDNELSESYLETLVRRAGGSVDSAVSLHINGGEEEAEEVAASSKKNEAHRGSFSLISLMFSPEASQEQRPLLYSVDGSELPAPVTELAHALELVSSDEEVFFELEVTPMESDEAGHRWRWRFDEDGSLSSQAAGRRVALDVWSRDEAEDGERRLRALHGDLRRAVEAGDYQRAALLQRDVRTATSALRVLKDKARQLDTLIAFEKHPKSTVLLNQRWLFNEDGTIESLSCPGRVIEARRDRTTEKIHAVLAPRNGGRAQAWRLKPNHKKKHDTKL